MTELLQQAFDSTNFRAAGHQLVDQLADYLAANLHSQQEQVYQWVPPEEQLDYWQRFLQQPATADSLFSAVLNRSMHLHHTHYMGHQVAVPAPAAALSALMGAMLNNGTAVYEMGSVSAPMEKIIIAETAKAIGFDRTAEGYLTSGGTLANLTALLAARRQQAADDVWENGQQTRLAVMVSEEAHYCVDRAVRAMGWGAEGIIKVPANADYTMDTSLLEAAYEKARAKGIQVIAVVGSACSTSTGAYDDLEAIGSFCRKYKLWLHVDGAHGGAVIFSAKYAHLIRGIHEADSVVIDYHKMLLTPALTTALIFKNGGYSYETFAQKAQYLWEKGEDRDWYNLARRTFECTKHMMALRVYTLLSLYGVQLFDDAVTTLYDLGIRFAAMISARPGFELAVQPRTNIVCFRFNNGQDDEAVLNIRNSNIRKRLVESGHFYIVQTQLKGSTWLRVSLMNPFTGEKELSALLDAIAEKNA